MKFLESRQYKIEIEVYYSMAIDIADKNIAILPKIELLSISGRGISFHPLNYMVIHSPRILNLGVIHLVRAYQEGVEQNRTLCAQGGVGWHI